MGHGLLRPWSAELKFFRYDTKRRAPFDGKGMSGNLTGPLGAILQVIGMKHLGINFIRDHRIN